MNGLVVTRCVTVRCLVMNVVSVSNCMHLCAVIGYLIFSRASRTAERDLYSQDDVCMSVCVWIFFSDQPLSPSWFDRSR